MVDVFSWHGYDTGLGINSKHIDYIKESNVVQSRISSTRCYLLRRKYSGEQHGTDISRLPVYTYVETSPNYRAQIWPSGSLQHPDLNPEAHSREGHIQVYIDNVLGSRVLATADLLVDNDYCVVKRQDRSDGRVEIIFNKDFNPTLHTVELIYSDMNVGVNPAFLKRGDSENQSLHGWLQYTDNCYDNYQGRHQILVRMPLTTKDLVVNEEGRVTLEENESWMIWTPYVKDFDVVVVPSSESPNGREMRFEIVNKKDSVIQSNLVSQRFKLKYLETSDVRYKLAIYTSDTTVESLVREIDVTLWRYIASDLIYDSDYGVYISEEH
jgi:hypothetical protein